MKSEMDDKSTGSEHLSENLIKPLCFNYENKELEQVRLNEKLYHLLCNRVILLSEADLITANNLLDDGADPSYCGEGRETIVQSLILDAQPELLKKVLDKKPESVNAISLYVKNIALKKNFSEMTVEDVLFTLNKHPLQLAAERIRSQNSPKDIEIYNIINGYCDNSNILKKVNNCIEILYRTISSQIEEYMKNVNKPLLILFGENHDSLFTGLSECIAIIAAHKAGIKTFYREEDFSRLEGFNLDLKKMEEGESVLDFWKPCLLTRKLMSILKLEILPADFGSDGSGDLLQVDGHSQNWNIVAKKRSASPEGIKYRNHIMAEEYKKSLPLNVFSEVGAFHLHGLNFEEDLSAYFKIILLNSADEEYGKFDGCHNLESGFEDIESLLEAMNPHQIVEQILYLLMPQYTENFRTVDVKYLSESNLNIGQF